MKKSPLNVERKNEKILNRKILLNFQIFSEYLDSKLAYCLHGCQTSLTINIKEYEKVNPRTKKSLMLKNENVFFVDVITHKLLLSKWRKVT